MVVMNVGRIEQAGPPDLVYRRPESRFVADFIGRANLLSGEVLDVAEGSIDISLMGVSMRVTAGSGHARGRTATVVVRPESISVGSGRLRARVRRTTFLGSYVEYVLEVGEDRRDLLVIDGDWMSRGIHAPGEGVAWELIPERAYALPADGPRPDPGAD